MTHLLQLIHDHLKAQGYTPKITRFQSDNKPLIINRTSGNSIWELQNSIQLYNGKIINLNKADPELLTKITKWWREYQPTLEQLLQ